ncbi:putative RNA methyltransferase At5g10620 isoform X2 [Alnus glutinosa]|uniref:putative RNA methyltransferase At5g10620 isoform X2 n=1 Tax=Alnus glutinosa TaxID=3517 RepID=UPI002D7A060B|nr:putative RNA methyltransferase At5g10620 isoform X2 [Alnus glutinosa]
MIQLPNPSIGSIFGPGSLSIAFPLSLSLSVCPPMAISSCASIQTKGSTPLPGAGAAAGHCKYTGQSVRALPIRILTVGKKRSRGLQLLVDEYIGKLKNYCIVDDVQIRSNPRNARDVKAQVDDEDAAVMNLIRSDDWVVMLDENGQDIGSAQMAELVGDAGNTGASRLSLCIGGPYGHGRQLRERANLSIRLSTLVLNHQIALLVLMEQLYS